MTETKQGWQTRILHLLLAMVLACGMTIPATPALAAQQSSSLQVVTIGPESDAVDGIVANMTLDEKISQMIIPAMRTWDEENVTDLSAAPELAASLQKHQYGGIILFAQNVTGTAQITKLVSDLQVNNAENASASTHIPYFMPVDQEGGIVTRITSGTRTAGNMAIGATGTRAAVNAETTGTLIGEELAAIGFNVDFAPDIDVNSNPSNPIIGTRSFSDDPATVSKLGIAYVNGLAANKIVGTYKHFPGHGDTSVDSHIGTPSVEKTYAQLQANELVPFKAAVDAGADMIMTAHITYPEIDDEVTFADGSKGYYPATMSKKMITDILRGDLNYDGLVVTDALEMDAIDKAALVPGEQGSATYHANVAEKVINAGVDILLLPTDLTSSKAAQFYDDYIDALEEKVEEGIISESRINESVERILEVKEEHGILDTDTSGDGIDEKVANAEKTVGSAAHHATEMDIARQAITLVKNDDYTLPLSGHEGNIVFLMHLASHSPTVMHVVKDLQDQGLIDKDAKIDNLADGTTSGSDSAKTTVTIDYYYDSGENELHYTDELKAAIGKAQVVIGMTTTYNLDALSDDSLQYQGIHNAIGDAHAAGAKFALVSSNLPYDAARYQDADAILLDYGSSGADFDPTDRGAASGTAQAYCANLIAALEALFDNMPPTGVLPVAIPVIETTSEGKLAYADTTLYERGYGLGYNRSCAEISGADATHRKKSGQELVFEANARHDKLAGVMVDGKAISSANYSVAPGSTLLTLDAEYLDSLDVEKHLLTLSYDYGTSTFSVDCPFVVTQAESANPEKSSSTTSTTSVKASTAKSSTTTKTSTAKTGDTTPIAPIIAVAAIALLAFGLVFFMRRRKKDDDDLTEESE